MSDDDLLDLLSIKDRVNVFDVPPVMNPLAGLSKPSTTRTGAAATALKQISDDDDSEEEEGDESVNDDEDSEEDSDEDSDSAPVAPT